MTQLSRSIGVRGLTGGGTLGGDRRLRPDAALPGHVPFRVPALVPIAGALICVGLLTQSTLREFAVVAAVLAIAAAGFCARTRLMPRG